MTRSGKPPRYKLISHPAVSDDLQALAAYGPDVIVAARAALDDLAHGRVIGKALGERRVSGDLTGLAQDESSSAWGVVSDAGSMDRRIFITPLSAATSAPAPEGLFARPDTVLPRSSGSFLPVTSSTDSTTSPGNCGEWTAIFDRLIWTGWVSLAEGDPRSAMRRLCLTGAGATRYAELCERERTSPQHQDSPPVPD